MKTAKHRRIHPNVALEIKSGNSGVAIVSIVATVSIDDAIFGIDEMQSARTNKTKAMLCHGGFAFGNVGLFILQKLTGCACIIPPAYKYRGR